MVVDNTTLWMLVLRWFHLVSGITWIGLLYFFNLVNVPFTKSLDGPTKNQVIPRLLPRALWWFRWGAMVTVISGLLLVDQMARLSGDWNTFVATDQGRTILVGGVLGIIMWANVWLIIWPNQRKVIAATEATAKTGAPAPADQPKWARQAYLASRTNFVLSLPMLVMMASSSHLGDLRSALVLGGAAAIGGLIWVWYLAQPKKAPAPAPAPPPTVPPNP